MHAGSPAVPLAPYGTMTPAPHRVIEVRPETANVVTLSSVPVEGAAGVFRAGQFHMLTAFGVGESAISISSPPRGSTTFEHTVRDVGAVTHALCTLRPGDVLGVRGPFGTDWGIETLGTGLGDVVVVAGGIGLAPLRGAIEELAMRRQGRGPDQRLFVLVGARQPDQVVFAQDLERWARLGVAVAVTVDVGDPGWDGHVGLVTTLFHGAGFDPARTTALLCGPEIMMRFTARALAEMGVDPGRIRVSLERNMQCGLAWCGHCQLGPLLLCRDGPVVPYGGEVAELMTQRER